MALVDKSISSGDLFRITTKISLAINDSILRREEQGKAFNEEKRQELAKATAEGICKTLGITIQPFPEDNRGQED